MADELQMKTAQKRYAGNSNSRLSATEFIAKWSPGGKAYRLSERAGAQAHFIDLCQLLDVDTPDDPENYCFERGLRKTTTSRGFADVWKRECFAWEYKAPNGDLGQALQQLIQYALPLENPPLLIVSDRLKTEIHTHFTGHPSQVTTLLIEDFRDPQVLDKIRAIFIDPYRFKPQRSNRDITEDAASAFATIADRLRSRGVESRQTAHFLTQCVFCFFAEDTKLLPNNIFKKLLQRKVPPEILQARLGELFSVMQRGGNFGADDIDWFNGGLFNEINVPNLVEADVAALHEAAHMYWKAIDPSIFGTLFERGLDPDKRVQLGAHYTDPTTILRLVEPTVKRPLLAEWERTRSRISLLLSRRDYLRARAKGIPSRSPDLRERFARIRTQANEAHRKAQGEFSAYLEHLRRFTVLDPACGSGNFLYIALKCIKDIEHQVNIEAEGIGLERQISVTGPHNVLGIEINSFAAELARVTVWIGELQWLIEHGYDCSKSPVLRSLDHIENKDALMEASGKGARWPRASVVVGNPPFLGDKKMRAELGSGYTEALRKTYEGRIPGGADLVCYWFEKARHAVVSEGLGAAGLVATNSIRGGKNRYVLDAISKSTRIFEAWSNEAWINEGAAVRVSLIAFGNATQAVSLDGVPVSRINSDLSRGGADSVEFDLSEASVINSSGVSFIGTQKGGAFDIPGDLAREWLGKPNPNGRPNSDVLSPWVNGLDIVRRCNDMWIIDFGFLNQAQASMYELPWSHCEKNVRSSRIENRERSAGERWWQLQRSRPELKSAIKPLKRYIATARVAKHRLFTWQPSAILPDSAVVAIAREDDCTFGILQSRFHELWSLRLGTSLEDRPRYTPTSCFETFPFPLGMSPSDTAGQDTLVVMGEARIPGHLETEERKLAEAIALAAKTLNDLREAWLNPPQWTQRISVSKGEQYPARIVSKPGFEFELAERTLTKLYNLRPRWLEDAHLRLDQAVANAYRWKDYHPTMSEDEILMRLLKLNKRSAVQKNLTF